MLHIMLYLHSQKPNCFHLETVTSKALERDVVTILYLQVAYQLFLIVALYAVPLVLMGAAYTKIAICLWSTVIPSESVHTSGSGRASLAGARVTQIRLCIDTVDGA